VARRQVNRPVLVAALGLAACVGPGATAPEPGEPADVTVMRTVAERVRARPPHRGFPLAVAPVTVSFEPSRYPLDLRREFASAVADLATKQGRLDPIRPPYLSGVPIRREGVYDPYDLAQYLLIRFSPVGFSADSARAALVVVYDCGPGCGSRAGIGLRRSPNGGWRVAQVRPIPEPPAAGP
jgi:hypothetical protein